MSTANPQHCCCRATPLHARIPRPHPRRRPGTRHIRRHQPRQAVPPRLSAGIQTRYRSRPLWGEALASRGFRIASERLRSVTASAGPEDWHPTVPVATMFTELSPPVKGSRSPSWFKMYDAAWSWETGNTKTQPPAPRELSHPEGARPDTPSPRIQGRNPSSQQYRTRQRPIRQIMLNAGG